MSRSVPILHTVSALQSMKNRGITLRNAIRECVDNSWDWIGDAKLLGNAKIRVHLHKQGDALTVSVLDNGMGIPDHVEEGQDGQGNPVTQASEDSMDGLQMALRVGGRIRKHHLSPIGRFGFGLPQSAIALCYDTHTRVHTKTKNGEWRWLDLDVTSMLEAITPEQPRPMLSPPNKGAPSPTALPPSWQWDHSGTMVTFHEIPLKIHNITEVQMLAEELVKELGQVYRYAINDGLELSISSNEMLMPRTIEPYDPMCMMPRSFTSKFGPVDEWETLTIPMDGGSSRPYILDPTTGQPAVVEVRFVRLEPGRVRQALGVADTAKKLPSKEAREHGFRLQDQGFSLVRGQREIGTQATFGLFTPDVGLRYFRGEVHFPPIQEIDRLFGIEPDKSKFKASHKMLGWMQPARRTITGINKKTRLALKKLSEASTHALGPSANGSRRQSGPISRATLERESQRLKAVLPPVKPTETDEALRSIRTHLENGEIEEVEAIHDRLIERTQQELHHAQDAEDWSAEQDAMERLNRLTNDKEWAMKHLQERFAEPAFFRTHESGRTPQRLLWSHWTDEGPRLVLNTKTPFYSEVYAQTEEDSRQRAVLDLMLWAIAYADANPMNSPELTAFWNRIHPIIAQSVSRLLTSIDVPVVEQETPTRRKIEIATGICEALGIERPPELKGSTIPRTFYEGVGSALGVPTPEKMPKHEVYKRILGVFGTEVSPTFMSSGATITAEGLRAIEKGVLKGISSPSKSQKELVENGS